MSKNKNIVPRDNNIIRIPLEEAMPENYLPYAVEVAKDRALPDVRDGLKPVHRRILYGAYLLKAFPDRPYYKSARIVGDILGKFHPHGDSSVYDATVIMAQEFSTREPLIDGHGNWGSIDGDSAAAMRYTEARLSKIAMEIIRDIDKDVVDMVPNYSDSEMEPKVLPCRYPNLLVNGTFGIAVGLATNIPPHNITEVIDGTLAYIDNPEITTSELLNYIKGPDLPTGGILIGKQSLLSAYETGEGKVTLRAKTSIEKLENGRLGIIITEFPFRRNKAKLLQTISEMTGDKRHAKALEAITDIRDESDRNGIRAVIELKRSADEELADKILKYLFKKTDLQCNINFNMVALADGKPETMGLKVIIKHYVNHQKDVVTRRTIKELEIAEKRFHIVEGFIKAIDILDKVIATIRESKSKKEANTNLVEKFGFTEMQAEAILELMLYRLTGLEIKVFQKEYKELARKIKSYKKILSNEKELLKVIKGQLEEVKEEFGNPRRTEIIEDDKKAKIDIDELIVVEDVKITLSNDGYIKRIPVKSYIRTNGNVEDIEYREGDSLKVLLDANTKNTMLIFTNIGNMYQLKVAAIPEYKWKEKGERLDSIIKGIDFDKEFILNSYIVENFEPNKVFQFITNKGGIKKTGMDKFITGYSKLLALKLKEDEQVVRVDLFDREREAKFLHIETSLGLNFTLEEPEIEEVDRNIMPVNMFMLANNNSIKSAEYVDEGIYEEFLINLNDKGIIKSIKKANNSGINLKVSSTDEIIVFTSKGNVYKFHAYLLSHMNNKISLEYLVDGFNLKEEKILSAYAVKEYNEDLYVHFFTKNGMVKKTSLSEYSGEYSNAVAHKLKSSSDKVVSVVIGDGSSELIIVTKKGMAIKFSSDLVNPLGRVALGVTGISLKEDDEVIFGEHRNEIKVLNSPKNNEIAITYENYEKIVLKDTSNNVKEISIDDIKLQNRAGRGTSLIITTLENMVDEVLIK